MSIHNRGFRSAVSQWRASEWRGRLGASTALHPIAGRGVRTAIGVSGLEGVLAGQTVWLLEEGHLLVTGGPSYRTENPVGGSRTAGGKSELPRECSFSRGAGRQGQRTERRGWLLIYQPKD